MDDGLENNRGIHNYRENLSMGEFFKGRRRKTGVATLVLSVVISIAWFRSYLTNDWLHLPAWQPAINSLNSSGGVVIWSKIAPINRDVTAIEDNDLEDLLLEMLDLETKAMPYSRTSRKWIRGSRPFRLTDRNVSEIRTTKLRYAAWSIPYWSIVLPLTLLSGYLLLVKPRVAKPKKAVESTTAAGT